LLTVDRRGLISWLRISPDLAGPAPATWAGVDAAVQSAAPQVRLLVAEITGGSCQPVHGLDPDTPAPLGAAFKLYVLDALGDAVAAGTIRWNQPLTVTAQLKSLPAGELQDEPDGTAVSVLDTAAAMISLSDNTATDMLINLLGRPAVEAALTRTGIADPALDRPFLTTREIFTLKLDHWPALAERYLAADQAGRRALLAGTVDRAPLPAAAAAGAWIAPRAVTSLEYFASASDICRVYASLAALSRRPGLAPIGQVLSLNDDGLQLDPAQWTTTWFKGGSEPGVLTLAFMATTRTGHSYVVTVLPGESRRWRGEEPEEPDSPLGQLAAGHQRPGDPAAITAPLLQVGQHRQRDPAAGPEQRAPGQTRRVGLRQRPGLVGPQVPLSPPQRAGEIGQQPQRVQLTLGQGQEHLTGRRVREAGREHRETALVAADDAELLTRQPGQPVPRNIAGLQQVNKPVPARDRGDLLANTPAEIRNEPARATSHASTLPRSASSPGRPHPPRVARPPRSSRPPASSALPYGHHGARMHRRLAAVHVRRGC